MDFQIVKGNRFYELILRKSGFGVALKFLYVGRQPDRFAEVKCKADFIQRLKHFMGSGILRIVFYGQILSQMVVIDYFCPHSKHDCLLLWRFASYIRTADAAAAFNDSAFPSMGILK